MRPTSSSIATRASRMGVQMSTIDNVLYDAFGQRQVSTMYTQLNQYHVILEVKPNFQLDPSSLSSLYVASSTGTQVPLSTFVKVQRTNTPLSIDHLGQFPASTISFNLAPGASLGDAVKVINQVENDLHMPETVNASFQGTAKAFEASLTNEPILILAALITVYIVLGVLYESYIHPVTILSTLPSAGVGAILALLLFRHGPQRHRHHRHHPADRHREEERHHDDRLRARSRTRRAARTPKRPSTRPACCASGPS